MSTPDTAQHGGGRAPLFGAVSVLLVLLLSVLLGGCGSQGRPSAAQGDRAGAGDTSATDAGVDLSKLPETTRPGRPTHIVIRRLGVDVPVVPINTVGRTLTPPADADVLGWWSAGAEPGAAHGTALVTGHTVHTGGGALDHLSTVRVGDPVTVTTARGKLAYRVVKVVDLSKARLARTAARLFDQRGPGRLVIVTCSGWDGEEYLSNTVVTAQPR